MPVNHDTIRLAYGLRIIVDRAVGEVTRSYVAAWARAWGVLQPEWAAAVQDLIDQAEATGKWPSRRAILRAERAMKALEHTRSEIFALTDFAGIRVVASMQEVTEPVAEWTARLIGSQLPRELTDRVDVVAAFNRTDPSAISAIVERGTGQVTSLLKPLAPRAYESMLASLIRGVALGQNPRTAAGLMVKRVEHSFTGGLTRALVIARTEMLDAHRSAAAAAQFDNTDVLEGWLWQAKLDTRTCSACWGMHGTLHELTEVGPIDHHQGRCARTPKVKSWADLGFDLEEPESDFPDAQAIFDALPVVDQLEILGPIRLKALRAGLIQWSDLAVVRSNDGWRDSIQPTPTNLLRRKLLKPVR